MNALFVTTSIDQLAPGHPTGLWLEEFALPYMAVTEAGIAVTVASPKGGAVPLDPKTEPKEKQSKDWAEAIQALRHSVALDSVKEAHFDAIFIPGGHGPMVDLANDATLHALVARHDAGGKLIAAVCHGPAALVNARRSSGEPFLKGRRATGFTNTEERLVGLTDVVPFLLEDAMKSSGADFHSALVPMFSHIERDANLLTGQNPHSSAAMAKEMAEALSKR
jgi:putative intracellular protease/amidase